MIKRPSKLKKVLKIIVTLLAVLGLAVLIYITFGGSHSDLNSYEKQTLTLKDQTITVLLADSVEQQIAGLSGTRKLPKDGMLFMFPTERPHGFWMKDMNYPIDIMWFDADLRLVHIEKSLSPKTYPKTFGDTVPAQYILETRAGFAEEHHVVIGDEFYLN